MAKVLVIVKMKTTLERGVPDIAENISFVHCGSVLLPGNYKAFVVVGTGTQLQAIANHANFLVGQQITSSGDVEQWQDARTAIAPGAATKINTWLVNNGHEALTAEDSIVDLIRIFQPGYEPGTDNVWA